MGTSALVGPGARAPWWVCGPLSQCHPAGGPGLDRRTHAHRHQHLPPSCAPAANAIRSPGAPGFYSAGERDVARVCEAGPRVSTGRAMDAQGERAPGSGAGRKTRLAEQSRRANGPPAFRWHCFHKAPFLEEMFSVQRKSSPPRPPPPCPAAPVISEGTRKRWLATSELVTNPQIVHFRSVCFSLSCFSVRN